MSDTRAKFRKLSQAFETIPRRAPDGMQSLGDSYVPEAHEEFRRDLEMQLDVNENAKLLIAGQPGCGKTTLLQTVAQKLRVQGRLVAFVNLEAHTAIHDLGSVEMHIAAAAELLLEAGASGATISGETLASCCAWLGATVGAEPSAEPAAIAGALRRLLASGREKPELRDELRRLIKDGTNADPIQLVAAILADLIALDRRPVVLLDGLDKLSPETARATFLDDKARPMADAPGAAILTVPLTVVYEPRFAILGERYNNARSAVLPAVRLWDFDPLTKRRVRSEKGVAVLRRIVEARIAPVDPAVIMPDAVERAIVGSAGNIRELARLVQSSIIKTLMRGGDTIELQDIEAAIADWRESYGRGYEPRFLPLLKKVRDESVLEDTSELGKLLLYGLWVIEYRNGTTWYCLPAPVEQLVHQKEQRSR